MPSIYLDHSATTPVGEEILQAMLPFLSDRFGNASSIHQYGQEARAAVEHAREQVARVINARESEIIFVSGGTEADNLAIQGSAAALKEKGNHIITSLIEHQAVIQTCEHLEKQGYEVTYLEPDQHSMTHPGQVAEAISPETILISIMHANNEIGTINPIGEIGRIARDKNIRFHTDAVQSFGKLPIDVNVMNVDLLSISAHKIYGPKGVGALYVRQGTVMAKVIHGGEHERNKRGGTENVAGIVALGKAAEISLNLMASEAQRLMFLQGKFWQEIREIIPDASLNGHPDERIPGHLSVSFPGVDAESLLISFDLKGIAASSGSACASGSNAPSHVLAGLKLPLKKMKGTIRFSLGRTNTEDHIDYTAQVLQETVERLRALAPTA
jgi:cysteine desulfurase